MTTLLSIFLSILIGASITVILSCKSSVIVHFITNIFEHKSEKRIRNLILYGVSVSVGMLIFGYIFSLIFNVSIVKFLVFLLIVILLKSFVFILMSGLNKCNKS